MEKRKQRERAEEDELVGGLQGGGGEGGWALGLAGPRGGVGVVGLGDRRARGGVGVVWEGARGGAMAVQWRCKGGARVV